MGTFDDDDDGMQVRPNWRGRVRAGEAAEGGCCTSLPWAGQEELHLR